MSDAWKHQREAIEWCRGRQNCILHLGMGCGKSRIALEVLKEEFSGYAGRFLLGCPKAVVPNWPKQVALWWPELRVLPLIGGSSAEKDTLVFETMERLSGPILICGNYESFWRMKSLEKMKWDCLVWDEVHRLKSPGGKASKWAAEIGKKNPDAKRLALSGTLLSQSPMDAFGTWRAVESPNCTTWGKYVTSFRTRYFQPMRGVPGAFDPKRMINEPEFSAKVAATTFHRRSEDVLDLPPILHQEIPCDMTPKQAKLYDSLDDDFIAGCDDGTITPSNVLTKVLRQLEVCNGYARYDETEMSTAIDDVSPKAAALADMLDCLEDSEPVVVFARFRSDIAQCRAVCERMGRSFSELSGKLNDLADWQLGKTSVLIAQIQSGGIGIDLTRASYGCFFSLGYSLSEYLQAVARLHRPGQKKTTHFYSLVATLRTNKTMDGRIYDALTERKEVIDYVLDFYSRREPVNGSAVGEGGNARRGNQEGQRCPR